jgi:NTE family protein
VTGREVVLSAGTVIDAILASAAIPSVFPPVANGGVAAHTPIATAIRLGATRLVVLPTGFACAAKKISSRPMARALHAISLLGARQLLQDFDRHSATTAIHVVPTLCPVHHFSYDYSHGTDLIARARESTRAWIASGGLMRSEFPPQLLMHTH